MGSRFRVPWTLNASCTYSLSRFVPRLITVTDNPSGATCYGLSQSAMVSWISDLSSTYHSKTGRFVSVTMIS